MDAPAARAHDRRCVPAAVLVVSLAGQGRTTIARPALGDLRSWRIPGCGRMVDGGLWARGARRGLAIPAGLSSDAGLFDLCRIGLDRAGAGAAVRPAGA